ncbi:MAG TPA: hypothetical protein DCG47_11800, partial [Spirochaetaceae bacterium]|nr:hypothetical protein [Spirochaetaceae bacterium]
QAIALCPLGEETAELPGVLLVKGGKAQAFFLFQKESEYIVHEASIRQADAADNAILVDAWAFLSRMDGHFLHINKAALVPPSQRAEPSSSLRRNYLYKLKLILHNTHIDLARQLHSGSYIFRSLFLWRKP